MIFFWFNCTNFEILKIAKIDWNFKCWPERDLTHLNSSAHWFYFCYIVIVVIFVTCFNEWIIMNATDFWSLNFLYFSFQFSVLLERLKTLTSWLSYVACYDNKKLYWNFVLFLFHFHPGKSKIIRRSSGIMHLICCVRVMKFALRIPRRNLQKFKKYISSLVCNNKGWIIEISTGVHQYIISVIYLQKSRIWLQLESFENHNT